MELVESDLAALPGVEPREYGRGERLAGSAPERLLRLHVYIRDGAIALRMAVTRSTSALLEVFGRGRLLSPRLWEARPGSERRDATALLPTTTLEVPTEVLQRQLAQDARLGLALSSLQADWHAASLDRLMMLALRDPLRRVAHTLLLLLDRLAATPSSTSSARLEVGQELIAAFASLSRQTTNRQLQRLAREGVARLQRRAVDVQDLAALRAVAAGRRPVSR